MRNTNKASGFTIERDSEVGKILGIIYLMTSPNRDSEKEWSDRDTGNEAEAAARTMRGLCSSRITS